MDFGQDLVLELEKIFVPQFLILSDLFSAKLYQVPVRVWTWFWSGPILL